jgi:hypothetical protein
LKKFKKVEFADQDIVIKFVNELAEILDIVDLDIEDCFITDESMYGDFQGLVSNNKKLYAFKEKYGFIPEGSQYLYEIAQKMVCKRKQ